MLHRELTLLWHIHLLSVVPREIAGAAAEYLILASTDDGCGLEQIFKLLAYLSLIFLLLGHIQRAFFIDGIHLKLRDLTTSDA